MEGLSQDLLTFNIVFDVSWLIPVKITYKFQLPL